MRCLIILSFIACLTSCDHDSFHADNSEIIIELKHIEGEAAKRGISLDWKNLKVLSVDHSGSPSRYDPNTHTIYIDTTDWSYHNTREELIAHEFGHAILRRQHDFSRLPNGMYKSVMGNFASRQYSGWSADTIRYRQQYYYDELFNPNTGPPNW